MAPIATMRMSRMQSGGTQCHTTNPPSPRRKSECRATCRLPRINNGNARVLFGSFCPARSRLTSLLTANYSTHYRKGVSFLSRIIGGKKKDPVSDAEDDVSEPETGRMDAEAAQPIGFIPRFPRPPKYLRVRAQFKKEKTFSRVFVAQELEAADELSASADKDASSSTAESQTGSGQHTGKAVWALVFSNDGKYLAAAGQDRKVRIWAVIASSSDREAAELEGDEDQNDSDYPKLKAPVFRSKPIQVFEGHTGSILDLSWSKVCLSGI